jgi:hypothetical protein
MKFFTIQLLSCFLTVCVSAQTLNWAKKMGGTQEEFAADIATDAQSNVLISGYFNGTADFDPGATVSNLTSSGAEDIFITKLTATGDLSWVVSIGGTAADKATSIATDAQGNVYAAGFFTGTVDFDPGAGVSELTSSGSLSDIFLVKLNSAGAFQWVKQIGNLATESYCNLQTDGQGNILLSSVFTGTIDLDPGPGVQNATSASNGTLVIKITPGGNLTWGKSIPDCRVFSFVMDATNSITFTGSSGSGADLDPGAGTAMVPLGFFSEVAVVFRWNASGTFTWLKALGSKTFPGGGAGFSIGLDPSGNVLVSGYFMGTLDLNPGTNTADTSFVRTSGGEANQWDIFLVKLSTTGTYQWGFGLGSTGTDFGSSVIADASGSVWLQSMVSGNTDFDPGSGTRIVQASGFAGTIAKYSATGQLMMADRYASATGISLGMPMTPKLKKDATGAIISAGNFSGNFDAAPGSAASGLISAGSYDVYVSKLTACSAPAITTQPVSQNVCPGSLATFSVTPSGSGPFTYQWKKGTTVLSGSTNTFSIASATITNVGTYSVAISTVCGITTSSAVTLTLKAATAIGTPPAPVTGCAGTNASFSVAATGTGPFTYVWKKGSSVVGGNTATLSLTNISQANAGAYTVNVTGACGSVLSTPVSLTVNTVSPIAVQSGQSLTVSTPGTYQWLNCLTGNSVIAGQTASSFTPTVSGSYAVRVTSPAGCIGTSPCVNYTVTSVGDKTEKPGIRIFPNPVSSVLHLEAPSPSTFVVFDCNGKRLIEGNWNGGLHYVDVSTFASGIYSLHINNTVFRIVK